MLDRCAIVEVSEEIVEQDDGRLRVEL